MSSEIIYISNTIDKFSEYSGQDIEVGYIEDAIEYLQNLDYIAIDTETNGLDWNKDKVIMLQLGDNKKQFVIDSRCIHICKPLRDILEDPNKIFIGQNIKFDYKFLLSSFNVRLRNIWDTMLAECVIKCGKKSPGYSLKALCQRYLNIELSKEVRSQFSVNKDNHFTFAQIEYGARDIKHLHDLMKMQMLVIKQYDLELVLELENRAALAFAEIEYNGMCFDAEKWLKVAENVGHDHLKKEKELDDMILNDPKLSQFILKGFQMNMFGVEPKKTSILWSSPTQVGKVLKVLDPKIENTNMRELYKRQYKFPLIKVLIDYRKKAKLVTTYGKDFLKYVNKTSQKVHTLFWQILNTGRVSSGQTRSKNNPHQAPNMQNIPANNVYRNCFMAEEGWKIVTMDYSGQELRLIAEGSKDPTWIQAFKNNEDVHGKVASLIFKIDESEVRDKPEFLRGKSYRDVAKTINFGLAYGMSYMKLADTLDISITDAKEFINRYFEALPKIKSFLKLLGNYGKNNGYIKTFAPFRRIRWFEDWASLAGLPHKDKFTRLGEIERASKNTPIQGSGADMIKLALALIIEQINEHKLHNKVKIVSQVHDEISCEVRDDFVALWIELQETLMLKAGRVICKQIDMNVDYSVSDKWSK